MFPLSNSAKKVPSLTCHRISHMPFVTANYIYEELMYSKILTTEALYLQQLKGGGKWVTLKIT